MSPPVVQGKAVKILLSVLLENPKYTLHNCQAGNTVTINTNRQKHNVTCVCFNVLIQLSWNNQINVKLKTKQHSTSKKNQH